jgi:hypothetical protein
MKLQPLFYSPNFTKSINDKLYKIELETNEDDRELAETQSMAEKTNEITEALQTMIGFAQDFNNQLASLSTQRDTLPTRDITSSLPQTGKFLNAIDKTLRLIGTTDFNDFNPQNVDAINSYLDNLNQLFQSIMNQNLEGNIRSNVIAELFRQALNIRNQIKTPFENVINSLQTKMLSRRQTEAILGSGYKKQKLDKYGLFVIDDYQTNRFL